MTDKETKERKEFMRFIEKHSFIIGSRAGEIQKRAGIENSDTYQNYVKKHSCPDPEIRAKIKSAITSYSLEVLTKLEKIYPPKNRDKKAA